MWWNCILESISAYTVKYIKRNNRYQPNTIKLIWKCFLLFFFNYFFPDLYRVYYCFQFNFVSPKFTFRITSLYFWKRTLNKWLEYWNLFQRITTKIRHVITLKMEQRPKEWRIYATVTRINKVVTSLVAGRKLPALSVLRLIC